MVLWFLSIPVFIGILTVFFLLMLIIRHETGYSPNQADCIIILGAPALSHTFLYRKQKALQLYKKNYAPYIIATGGKRNKDPLAESASAVRYLEHHGISKDRILSEQKSTDTWHNLIAAKRIMAQNGFKTAIIVTTDFHLFRALRAAKKLKLAACGSPALAYLPKKWYYRFREVIGIVYYFLFGRI